jgi:RNA polymerase sigma factor (sigma-70 family)
MVFQVAQRLLHQEHDAEDVFQATFLTLARKAASLRKPGSVACWLHGVAHRLALQTREARLKRLAHESRVVAHAASDYAEEITLREARGLLDEELRSLSAKYRAPLVLCYLEGATRDEAARQLQVSLATLKRRLERGRELLRLRLNRRGLTVSTALAAVLLTESSAQTAVPASLLSPLVEAAMLLAANKPLVAGLVSAQAVTLMERMVRFMWITKLQTAALGCGLALAVAGTGVLAHQAWAGKASAAKVEQQLPLVDKGEANRQPSSKHPLASEQPGESIKVSEGKNYFVSPITTELQRALLAPQHRVAHAYVVLDGGALLRPDGAIDPAGLDWEALRKALASPKGRSGRKEAVVVFNPIYHDPFPPDTTRNFLGWVFQGFGYDLGFGRAYLSTTTNGGFKWDESRAAIAKKMAGKPDAAEPMTGNSAVHVYPVRTVFSRFLTGNADCVVQFGAPLRGLSADTLPPEVDQAIRSYVGKLQLKEKGKVDFRLGHKEDAWEAVKRFEENTSVKLAHELGFKDRVVTSWYEP